LTKIKPYKQKKSLPPVKDQKAFSRGHYLFPFSVKYIEKNKDKVYTEKDIRREIFSQMIVGGIYYNY